ncbi:hypothetical protein ALIPUT_01582 [Alistipes putredinis DSM 17216]|uniref:Uncharacterized protein n=1 Tax=Alistipes putredinis DSM 17216 TaxID=445970 RepID=B0MWS7_9BACT|nr:hypothetical protein ALIPUT_01582 [Alistipes putredinis DSM 17216]
MFGITNIIHFCVLYKYFYIIFSFRLKNVYLYRQIYMQYKYVCSIRYFVSITYS